MMTGDWEFKPGLEFFLVGGVREGCCHVKKITLLSEYEYRLNEDGSLRYCLLASDGRWWDIGDVISAGWSTMEDVEIRVRHQLERMKKFSEDILTCTLNPSNQ